MNVDEMSFALQKIKEVSERLTVTQEKSITRLNEKTEKKIDTKINEACKRLTEKTIAEIKERLEMVNDVEKVSSDIKQLKRITEDLIDRHTILTEVAYLARQRLDYTGQAKVNAELIKSMDFGADWFKRRNDMSLNNLLEMYKNGVEQDVSGE